MYLLFTILGIIFLAWDLVNKNTNKLVFATTFLFCAVVAFKFPDNYFYQISSFFMFGILSFILINSILKKEQLDYKKQAKLKDYIGSIALVKKDIGKTLSIDGIGQIELNGDLWSAKSVDDKIIKAGNNVRVVSRENMIMNVKLVEDKINAN